MKTREKRAQERCRVLKDYGEKAKARVGELEAKCGEQERSLAEGERQRARYRKELRDTAAEAAAATNALDHRDMDMSEIRQRSEHLRYRKYLPLRTSTVHTTTSLTQLPLCLNYTDLFLIFACFSPRTVYPETPSNANRELHADLDRLREDGRVCCTST